MVCFSLPVFLAIAAAVTSVTATPTPTVTRTTKINALEIRDKKKIHFYSGLDCGVSTHQSDYIKSQNSGAGYYLNEKGAALVPANAHSVYIIGTFAGYYASSNSDCITTPQYQQGYASGQMNQTCNLLDGQFKPPLPASSPDANGYYPQPDPSTALPMVAQIGRIQCIDDY